MPKTSLQIRSRCTEMQVKRLLQMMIRVAKFFIAQCEAEVERCNEDEKQGKRRIVAPQ